ncbi:Uncharacterized protein YhiN [hydrothermal vent metagenome]|uniref:Uncharacterized protein YhiN n=1 Tax=hydrothermal vent metagenome TaxID=652676 RepID=A0A3B0RVB3_9ZZZZ
MPVSQMQADFFDTIIIGAGAAGLMCAAVAGARGRKVLLLDHAKAVGEKIRISGGGRCNFTNLHCGPHNFISQNPHFCKSALAGYSPQGFIQLVEQYGIAWHEKTLGQLFCDGSASQIVQMLVQECQTANVDIRLSCKISQLGQQDGRFLLHTDQGVFQSNSVVVACGGPSIPKMGASGYGYDLAKQFALQVITPRAALVPLTLNRIFGQKIKTLAGLSLPVRASCGKISFDEAMLFTHRGLSGPAILQISSYWTPDKTLEIDLAPGAKLLQTSQLARDANPKQSPAAFLSNILPKRLAQTIAETISQQRMADMSDLLLRQLAEQIHHWQPVPSGTEGYRIAEVTRGGVDTCELSSKTMQAKQVPGLYFIGEVVDVTGHLGGHNFQWAWASGTACGQAL